tara:strand:- start:438 stop:542 length:105 start_codon:yes stop_codon:yes gene_type:complete
LGKKKKPFLTKKKAEKVQKAIDLGQKNRAKILII